MGFSKLAGNIVFTTKKYSPEIKFIFGVISLGAALYTTHKAALKSQKILEKRKEKLQAIDEVLELVKKGEVDEYDYTEQDAINDEKKIKVEYVASMVKNYSLPAVFAGASIFCFRGAMMDYKNIAVGIGAAYNALMAKYNDKMKFIKEQVGEEKFNELEEGFKSEKIKESQNTGLSDPKEKKEFRDKCNPYSRFFDECHGAWTGDPDIDKLWLIGKENMLNARLQRNGFLFLNDAYEDMGFEPTDAGRVMGWLAKKPDGTTNYIDFGIFNIHDQASRWFVNGLEPVFLIDFNVDPQPITGRVGWAKY